MGRWPDKGAFKSLQPGLVEMKSAGKCWLLGLREGDGRFGGRFGNPQCRHSDCMRSDGEKGNDGEEKAAK